MAEQQCQTQSCSSVPLCCSHALSTLQVKRDLLLTGPPGCGMTHAVLIPLLQSIMRTHSRVRTSTAHPSALIVCPTRELAMQTAQEAQKLAANSHLKVYAVTGGASKVQQVRRLLAGADDTMPYACLITHAIALHTCQKTLSVAHQTTGCTVFVE